MLEFLNNQAPHPFSKEDLQKTHSGNTETTMADRTDRNIDNTKNPDSTNEEENFKCTKNFPFPPSEMKRRFKAIQKEMESEKLDAIFMTTEANVHYYTGFVSQFWQSPTRPFFLIIPRTGDFPIVVTPGCCKLGMQRTWIPEERVKSWAAPNPVDDGVTLVLETLRNECPHDFKRVGVPMGQEASLRMPLRDYLKIGEEFNFVDCTAACKKVRSLKSSLEVAKTREVCRIVGEAFGNYSDRVKELMEKKLVQHLEKSDMQNNRGNSTSFTPTNKENVSAENKDKTNAVASVDSSTILSSSDISNNLILSEAEMVRAFKLEAIALGVDDAPYVIGASGTSDGYPSIVDGPSCIKISDDEDKCIFGIDTGCKFDGYYSDYTNNWEVRFIDQDVLNEAMRDAKDGKIEKNNKKNCYSPASKTLIVDHAIKKQLEKESKTYSSESNYANRFNKTRKAHTLLHESTTKALELIQDCMRNKKPLTCNMLWKAMAEHLGICNKEEIEKIRVTVDEVMSSLKSTESREDISGLIEEKLEEENMESDIGRMGHGLGLELTEWPNLAPWDETPIVPGMLMTLEPSLRVSTESSSIICHEENLWITENGYELLSRRAPAQMETLWLISDKPSENEKISKRMSNASKSGSKEELKRSSSTSSAKKSFTAVSPVNKEGEHQALDKNFFDDNFATAEPTISGPKTNWVSLEEIGKIELELDSVNRSISSVTGGKVFGSNIATSLWEKSKLMEQAYGGNENENIADNIEGMKLVEYESSSPIVNNTFTKNGNTTITKNNINFSTTKKTSIEDFSVNPIDIQSTAATSANHFCFSPKDNASTVASMGHAPSGSKWRNDSKKLDENSFSLNSKNNKISKPLIPSFELAESLCSSEWVHSHSAKSATRNEKAKFNNDNNTTFSSDSALTAYIKKLKADSEYMDEQPNMYIEQARYTVGLVMLPSDCVLETEAPSFFTQFPGVMWRGSKIFFDGSSDIEEITVENYQANAKNVSRAAASFFPQPKMRKNDAEDEDNKNDSATKSSKDSNENSSTIQRKEYGCLDCIALSCTSLSTTLGAGKDGRAQKFMLDGYDSENTGRVASCDMATAVKEAITLARKANKTVSRNRKLQVVLVTPYLDDMHDKMRDFVEAVDNVEVINDYNFGLARDCLVSALAPQRIQAKVLEKVATCVLEGQRVDAVVICCSAFRSTGYGFIDGIERELAFVCGDTNSPCVITSNQALFRHVMEQAVQSGKIARKEMAGVVGYGRLFRM